MKAYLDDDQCKLYELIWKRGPSPARWPPPRLSAPWLIIDAANGSSRASLRANGQVIQFDGFLAAYEVKLEEEDEEGGRLPELREGEHPKREKIEAKQHFTEPPPRYLGSLADQARWKNSASAALPPMPRRCPPSRTANMCGWRSAGSFLNPRAGWSRASSKTSSRRYVEYDFTADLEEKLDRISAGELSWKEVLRDFWKQFSASVEEIKDLRVTEVLDMLNEELAPLAFPQREDGSDPRICPTCGNGQLSA